MKITQIEAFGLRGATPEGGWTHELQPDDVVHTVLLVETDSGLSGVGSAFTSESLVRASLDVLRPLLLGADAREPDRISQILNENTFWQGRGGAITHAISGIDLALWDLYGKYLGQPVGQLLGGVYRTTVTPYASVLMDSPHQLRRNLGALREQGFRGFKIGWGRFGRESPAVDEEYVRTARESIGDSALLAVDAGGSDAFWNGGLAWAKRASEMLEAYGVAWFEEPLAPDNLDGFVELRKHSRVPIAGGEVLTRRQDFAQWLRAGAFDIVQPDLTKAGGFSEARRIAVLAESTSTRLIPHGWNTAIGLAADLQLAAALPHTSMVEYKTGSRYIDDLLELPFQLADDGTLEIPQQPGLGISLRAASMEEFSEWRERAHAPKD